ncbi:hypothetical protein B0O99DRAFT_677016 [Bisporella sp. PMI_857]|nr:hypothetical protein B0O99DRAFT_677016 [Bisporella sp. PMI_857]
MVYSRPECIIKPRFIFDNTLYDPLSITSLYGSEAMLRELIDGSEFDREKFFPNPAMGAADQTLQWGDLSRLRVLFFGNWGIVSDLIDNMLDISIRERWGNELLCMAASMGCLPIIRRLMDRAQYKPELKTELLLGSSRKPQAMSFGKPVHLSIGEAVLGNHVDIVEYLLQ